MFISKNTSIVVPFFVDSNYCYGNHDGIPWKTTAYAEKLPEDGKQRLANTLKWDYMLIRRAIKRADHFVVKQSYVKEMKDTFFRYTEACDGDVHVVGSGDWMKFKMDIFSGQIGGNVLLFCDPDMALELSEVYPVEVMVHRLPDVLTLEEKGYMNLDAIVGAGKLVSVTETYTGSFFERYIIGESWNS